MNRDPETRKPKPTYKSGIQMARDVFLLEKVLVVMPKIHDSKSQKQLNYVCQ